MNHISFLHLLHFAIHALWQYPLPETLQNVGFQGERECSFPHLAYSLTVFCICPYYCKYYLQKCKIYPFICYIWLHYKHAYQPRLSISSHQKFTNKIQNMRTPRDQLYVARTHIHIYTLDSLQWCLTRKIENMFLNLSILLLDLGLECYLSVFNFMICSLPFIHLCSHTMKCNNYRVPYPISYKKHWTIYRSRMTTLQWLCPLKCLIIKHMFAKSAFIKPDYTIFL